MHFLMAKIMATRGMNHSAQLHPAISSKKLLPFLAKKVDISPPGGYILDARLIFPGSRGTWGPHGTRTTVLWSWHGSISHAPVTALWWATVA